jgi:hypothetical protein
LEVKRRGIQSSWTNTTTTIFLPHPIVCSCFSRALTAECMEVCIVHTGKHCTHAFKTIVSALCTEWLLHPIEHIIWSTGTIQLWAISYSSHYTCTSYRSWSSWPSVQEGECP